MTDRQPPFPPHPLREAFSARLLAVGWEWNPYSEGDLRRRSPYGQLYFRPDGTAYGGIVPGWQSHREIAAADLEAQIAEETNRRRAPTGDEGGA